MPTSNKIGEHTIISPFYMLDALDELFIKDIAENKDFQQGELKSNRVIDFFKKEAHFTVTLQKSKEDEPLDLGYLQAQEVPHESGAIKAFKITSHFNTLKDTTLVLVEIDKPESIAKQVNITYKVFKTFLLATLKENGVAIEANLEELFKEIGKLLPAPTPAAQPEDIKEASTEPQPTEDQEVASVEAVPEPEKPAETSAEA